MAKRWRKKKLNNKTGFLRGGSSRLANLRFGRSSVGFVQVIEGGGGLGLPPEPVAFATQPWTSGRRRMDRWKIVITGQG